MQQYLALLEKTLTTGCLKSDRTGTGTKSIFGQQIRFDLREGLPLLTTKRLHTKSIIHELLWFLKGDTNIRYLNDNGVSIWNEWATETGELGPIYGAQWRNWRGGNGESYDQVKTLIENIRHNPDSRRHIISGWNVADLPDETKSPNENVVSGKMALPPCHLLYQWYVVNGELSGSLYIRSNDIFLGHPYNVCSLAIFTFMIAQQCDLAVGEIVVSIGDCHLYSNHFEQAKIQLQRKPKALPKLMIKRKPRSIFDYKFEDFKIVDYDPYPSILAPISV